MQPRLRRYLVACAFVIGACQQSWQTFLPVDSAFSVEMPGAPSTHAETLKAGGVEGRLQLFGLTPRPLWGGGPTSYVVAVISSASGDRAPTMADAEALFLEHLHKAFGARRESTTSCALPALQCTELLLVRSKTAVARARVVVGDKASFALAFIGTREAAYSAEGDRFLGSFKVLNQPAQQ